MLTETIRLGSVNTLDRNLSVALCPMSPTKPEKLFVSAWDGERETGGEVARTKRATKHQHVMILGWKTWWIFKNENRNKNSILFFLLCYNKILMMMLLILCVMPRTIWNLVEWDHFFYEAKCTKQTENYVYTRTKINYVDVDE